MKFGIRKPSIKKSLKARTTGKLKRSVKKAVIPGYGKKGMGMIKNPQKSVYNKIYNKTTIGIGDVIKTQKDGSAHSKSSNSRSGNHKNMNYTNQNKQISNGTLWLVWGGVMGIFAIAGQNIIGFLIFGAICFFLIKTGLSKRKYYQANISDVDHEDTPQHLVSENQYMQDSQPVIQTGSDLTLNQNSPKLIKSLEKFESLAKTNPCLKSNPCSHKWQIMVSFGKSTSGNYDKALYLAKNSLDYDEQDLDGVLIHTAIFDDNRDNFIDFINLYEIVSGWKSTTFFINGKIVDKKTVGKLKYCYGDKCRSVKSDFCYGASIMTDNPFGCHRLQISRFNNPWWGYYKAEGSHYALDRHNLLERINLTDATFKYCPAFNLEYIENMAMSLPLIITDSDYQAIIEKVNMYDIPYETGL